MSLLTILALEMRLKIFCSRKNFGDVEFVVGHDFGARGAIDNFLKLNMLWRYCECR